MKKSLCLMLAVMMAFALVACGGNEVDNDASAKNFVIATDKGFSPFEFQDADGNIVELESERLSATENRMWVSYTDMGDYLPQAFIAIEDKRFESHDGVDWVRTVKVTLDYFLGGGSQGGSTITQ